MKRRLLPLLLALLLVLCACEKQPDPITPIPDASVTPDAPPQESAVTLAQLDVEFVIGERSVDDLAQLQKQLPALLIDALAAQKVSVGTVHVTFGASAEATAEALRAGNVQVGFLPTNQYLAYEDALRLVGVGQPGTGVALLCVEQSIRTAAENGTLTWEQLANASWCVCGEDALAWLNGYLAAYFGEHEADELTVTRIFQDADGNYAMDDVAYDLYVVPFLPEDGAPEGAIASGVLYDEAAAVSTADEIVRSDAFASALSAALGDESLADTLALYGVTGYADDAYLTVKYGQFETQHSN